MTRRLARRFAAGLVAVTAVLSGCSDKQEANNTLPSTTAAQTTPELPPLGPEDLPMPDEARTQDAAGAEAFVRYYVELINRTSDVMDAQPLRDLSKDCRDCDRMAANIENDTAAGYHYENGELSVASMGAATVEGSNAELAFVVDQAPLQVVDSSGTPNEEMSSDAFSQLSSGAALNWESDRETWVITVLTLG